MPLFHSSAVQVGWAPSLVTPCAVGLGRRFSASRWLADVRHYGATYFNYTGKPLAYLLAQPERADDADNRLRVAFGNEGAPEVVDGVARRFGVERDRRVRRDRGRRRGEPRRRTPRRRARACARSRAGRRRRREPRSPRAELDERGRVPNAEESVGEIVNTQGSGPFEGYYNNDEATAKTTRFGWYWSGDLGYKDRRRLPLLRRSQRRLDPRRRRELPGRPDRGRRCARRPVW